MPTNQEIPMTEGCIIARKGSDQLRRMVLLGQVRGRKIGNRWFVHRDDCVQLALSKPLAQTA